ncbi:MAG: phage portal protein [Dehalococcoidia bacterium]|nr:phage portal protein [Dehalococcoidia bacterium]
MTTSLLDLPLRPPGAALPLPQQLARLDAPRLRAYRDNLEFYQGRQWTEPQRRRERRLTFNYAKTIIEKTASYTMTGVSFVVDPEDGSEESLERARRTERALRDVYEANALDQLDFDNEIDCSVLGDAAYKVTWDPAERRVRVSAPDVQGLYAWWVADDPSRVWRVASRYTLGHEEAEALYGRVPASRRGEHTVVEVWTDASFELWLDGALLEERPNPYGLIPFVIYPNVREPQQFWGVSDLPAIKEPLRELNRAVSQLSMILELSGNPIAVLENVTEAQDIAVQPGAVWEIPEKARAYLLDLLQGGGVGLHVDFANLVLRTLHDLAEVPRSAFGENRQALSGVALQMELDPLLKKVQRKRLIRGAAFRRRNEMVLRILEQQTGESFAAPAPGSGKAYRARTVWAPVLPQDRSRLTEDEARLVAAGIHSRRTAAGLLDVADPDGEWQRWQEEEAGNQAVKQSGNQGDRRPGPPAKEPTDGR